MAVVLSPGVRVTVAESLIRDLGRVSEWCDLCWMKLNDQDYDSLKVTHNASPITPINNWPNCTKGVGWPCYIGSDIWFQVTFEKHLRSVSRTDSQRLGILRKSWRVFHDRSLLFRCFRGFILPVLEYCSAVWCSVPIHTLKLLDRAVSGAWFLTGAVFECDIVDPWQYCVCCIRSGVTRCNLVMVLYLDRTSQCGFLAVLWSHIGTLMRRL